MLSSPGLRLALIGGTVFLFSLIAVFILPVIIGIAGMAAGGMAVWLGFIWTIFSYYSNLTPPEV